MSSGHEEDSSLGKTAAGKLAPEATLVRAVKELREQVDRVFATARLTALERNLCRKIYLENLDPEEVADDLGLPFETVCDLYRSALKKIREQLPKAVRTALRDSVIER